MKKAFLASLLTVFAIFIATAVLNAADKPADFAKKSGELTSSLTTRADKINAIFNFVRDEIAQIKTQYG